MKCLVDSACALSGAWPAMKRFLSCLGESGEIDVFWPSSLAGNEEIRKMWEGVSVAGNVVQEESDLSGYDVFFSCCSEPPACLEGYAGITTVAVLLDPMALTVSADENDAGGTAEQRFWRDYEYDIAWVNYAKDEVLRRQLLIQPEKLLLTNDFLDDLDGFTPQRERAYIDSHCEKENLALPMETLKKFTARKDNQPPVTIVTITFNLVKNGRADVMKECIRSVHTQSYPNIEHIIIDGGSQDGTAELLAPYEKDGWIKVYSEPDDGLYDAMNKGIRRANGKYVAFLNSDDNYCTPEAVRNSVMMLERTGAAYSFGDALALNTEGVKIVWRGDINQIPYAAQYCHQTMFVKTQLLKEIGGFDTGYRVSADSDLMIRLFVRKEKYCVVRQPLVLYRQGGFSAANSHQLMLDHSKTFYLHMGRELGLTPAECQAIWGQSFLSAYSPEHISAVLVKLGKEFRVDNSIRTLLRISAESSASPSLVRKAKQGLQKAVKKTGLITLFVDEKKGRLIKRYYLFGRFCIREKIL